MPTVNALYHTLVLLYEDALKSHVPPLTAAQRTQRAQNDVARLIEAVEAAGLALTLHVRGIEQGAFDLEEE